MICPHPSAQRGPLWMSPRAPALGIQLAPCANTYPALRGRIWLTLMRKPSQELVGPGIPHNRPVSPVLRGCPRPRTFHPKSPSLA